MTSESPGAWMGSDDHVRQHEHPGTAAIVWQGGNAPGQCVSTVLVSGSDVWRARGAVGSRQALEPRPGPKKCWVRPGVAARARSRWTWTDRARPGLPWPKEPPH